MVITSLRLTSEQNSFLAQKQNKSAYIRGLLDREIRKEEGMLERKIREIVQDIVGNYQFVAQRSGAMEDQCVSGLLEILGG